MLLIVLWPEILYQSAFVFHQLIGLAFNYAHLSIFYRTVSRNSPFQKCTFANIDNLISGNQKVYTAHDNLSINILPSSSINPNFLPSLALLKLRRYCHTQFLFTFGKGSFSPILRLFTSYLAFRPIMGQT